MKKFLLLLLLAAVLVLPCHAEEPLCEETISISYRKHGRSQTQQLPFRINLQDGQEMKTANFPLQVEAEADIFIYLNDVALPYADGCKLNLQQGENRLKVILRTANGTAEKQYTLHCTMDIPQGEYFDALSFCVENGIMTGDENMDLRPEATASRAELAAMVSRFLQLTGTTDLGAFSDVDKGAWYVPSLSACVGSGIMTGTDKGMEPKSSVTRQQAMVILARAFGRTGDPAVLSGFTDGNQVSAWAKSGVAAMAEGLGPAALRPKAAITRQELAELFYRAAGTVAKAPDEIPTAGTVLYIGKTLPQSLTLDGSIVLSSVEGDIDLTNYNVTGTVTVYTNSAVKWSGSIGSLCVRGTATLQPQSSAANTETAGVCSIEGGSIAKLRSSGTLYVKDCAIGDLEHTGGDLTAIGGKIENLHVNAPGGKVTLGTVGKADITAQSAVVTDAETVFLRCDESTILGNVTTASFPAENSSISVSGTVKAANFSASGVAANVSGTLENAIISAKNVTLGGSGRADSITLRDKTAKVSLACENVLHQYDAGLSGVVLTQFGDATATPYKATIHVSAKITGVDTQRVYGVPSGVRTVKAEFILDGKVVGSKDVHLKEDAVVSTPIWFSTASNAPTERTVLFRLTYGEEVLEQPLQVQVRTRSAFYEEAKTIKTIWVEATANRDLPLYKGEYLSNPTGYTIKKGETVRYIRNHGSSYRVMVADGTVGYAPPWGLKISDKVYYTDDVTYSIGAREAFVNELHDYASPTKYLLWLNLYTETLSVFEGSQGNWKFLKDCRTSSGKNISPTRPGVYYIYSRAYKWTFDDNYYYVKHPSLFDGGIAFHSRTYLTNGGGFLDSRLGMTISHGCVRTPDDMSLWIFENCAPGKTTVVVY